MQRGNLYDDASPPGRGERFEELARSGGVIVERIVSSADVEPTEYVQEQDEWVVLVRGLAALIVDGEAVAMTAGDWLFLPARTPHTVVSTSGDAVWLAVHIHPRPVDEVAGEPAG